MGLPGLGLLLKRFWVLVRVALKVAVGKVLLTLWPSAIRPHFLAMSEKTGMARNPRFTYEDWAPTFFSTQYFWFVLKVNWQQLEDKTRQGDVAPDSPVVHLSGQRARLWDFMQGQEAGAGWTGVQSGGATEGGGRKLWILLPWLLLFRLLSPS